MAVSYQKQDQFESKITPSILLLGNALPLLPDAPRPLDAVSMDRLTQGKSKIIKTVSQINCLYKKT